MKHSLRLMVISMAVLHHISSGQAGTNYWIAPSSSTASLTQNWSLGEIPTNVAHAVWFASSLASNTGCSIDISNFTAASVLISNPYTGTIQFTGGGTNHYIGGTLVQKTGSLLLSTAGIAANDNWSQNGGTLNMGSANLHLYHNFVWSGGTRIVGTSSVFMHGTGSLTTQSGTFAYRVSGAESNATTTITAPDNGGIYSSGGISINGGTLSLYCGTSSAQFFINSGQADTFPFTSLPGSKLVPGYNNYGYFYLYFGATGGTNDWSDTCRNTFLTDTYANNTYSRIFYNGADANTTILVTNACMLNGGVNRMTYLALPRLIIQNGTLDASGSLSTAGNVMVQLNNSTFKTSCGCTLYGSWSFLNSTGQVNEGMDGYHWAGVSYNFSALYATNSVIRHSNLHGTFQATTQWNWPTNYFMDASSSFAVRTHAGFQNFVNQVGAGNIGNLDIEYYDSIQTLGLSSALICNRLKLKESATLNFNGYSLQCRQVIVQTGTANFSNSTISVAELAQQTGGVVNVGTSILNWWDASAVGTNALTNLYQVVSTTPGKQIVNTNAAIKINSLALQGSPAAPIVLKTLNGSTATLTLNAPSYGWFVAPQNLFHTGGIMTYYRMTPSSNVTGKTWRQLPDEQSLMDN